MIKILERLIGLTLTFFCGVGVLAAFGLFGPAPDQGFLLTTGQFVGLAAGICCLITK